MILAEFFIPHGHCYLWKPELVGLHLVSDALTALAYYSIPLMLIYFVQKRRDVPFNWIFLLFGAFIIACGTGHVMDIWTLWHPDYWLSGFVKAFTAVVSLYTASELVSLLPQALAMPSAAQFEAVKIEIKERKRAEAELLREKTHLALAQKVAHVGSWEFNLATQELAWSDETFRIYGLHPEQPTPTLSEHRQKIHPDDRTIWDATVNQLLEGKSGEVEFRIVRPDGSIRHLLCQGKPIFNSDGQVEKLFKTLLDITERKLAEQAQARLTAILEATPDIIGICDAAGRKIYINPAGRQFHGIEPEEDITNHQISECHPPEVADFILNQAVPAAIANSVWRGETAWRRWDGEVFPASQVIIAHKSERGEVEYISTIARDISDLKQVEAALKESEKRFRALFEQAAVGIARVSLSGQFLQANQRYCDLIGYTESELLARTCQELIDPDDLKLTLEYQRQMLAGEMATYSLEKRYIRKDDKVQWVNSTVSLVRDSQGLPAYFIKVLEDIGERKQAEAALKQQLAAVEAARDGIAILKGAQEYIYLNEAHVRLYGYDSSTELLGKSWRELYYSDEIRRLEHDIFPMLSHQGHWQGEALGKKQDGSTFLQEVSLTLTADGDLICVCRDITERKQAEITLQQQVERERLVGAISLSVHQFLELEKILNTTVTEVRQFLQTDRVLIYRFNPDWSGQVVVESVGADWIAVLGSTIHDPCFGKEYTQLYQQGRVRAIANIYTAGLTPCYVELLAPFQVTACLTVPIMQGEKLWGLLIAHHCRETRQWQSFDIELLQQLATQVGIALQQSELYSRVQAELGERKRAEEALRSLTQQEQERALQLEQALIELQRTQTQLVQNEKMAGLGQLVAGVAHEINNPISFIYGNIYPAMEYFHDLLDLISIYQKFYPTPLMEVQDKIKLIDLDFIKEDFPQLLGSMKEGALRIQEIVLSLRNFSRLDETGQKQADLHQGIDSTLMILQNRLREQPTRAAIQVIKEFSDLPLVDCYPGELNQVFMNILSNAIDALEGKIKENSFLIPKIRIYTEVLKVKTKQSTDKVMIRIADNGSGIPSNIKQRVFDPFFTTKPVGKGTGLGLSISHSIVVKKHNGKLYYNSQFGQGTEFVIELPLQ